jgi:hypothetical protein
MNGIPSRHRIEGALCSFDWQDFSSGQPVAAAPPPYTRLALSCLQPGDTVLIGLMRYGASSNLSVSVASGVGVDNQPTGWSSIAVPNGAVGSLNGVSTTTAVRDNQDLWIRIVIPTNPPLVDLFGDGTGQVLEVRY